MSVVGEVTTSCPDPIVLPIVFVPGIMGSRLKQSASGLNVYLDVAGALLQDPYQIENGALSPKKSWPWH